MRIQIEPTDQIVNLDGVAVRLWFGVHESGAQVIVFVHRVAAYDPQAIAELELVLKHAELELVPQAPPKAWTAELAAELGAVVDDLRQQEAARSSPQAPGQIADRIARILARHAQGGLGARAAGVA